MGRLRGAMIIVPRRSPTRPVLEYAWAPYRAFSEVDLNLDLEPWVVVPFPGPDLQSVKKAIRKLHPRPRWISYPRVPGFGLESASLAVAAQFWLARSKPDFFLGSLLHEAGFIAASAGSRCQIPSAVAAHGTDVRLARGELANRRAQNRALAALSQANLRIAMSSRMTTELNQLGFRAETLPFTVFAQDFPLETRLPETEVLLLVGRIGPAKGADHLIRALSLMSRKAELHLVGSVDAGFDPVRLAEAEGVGPRVKVMGEIRHGQIARVYQKSSVVVLPSLHEGFGNVLVEGLLTGRPLVGSAVGGIPEIVGDHGGRLVNDRDPASLAQALDLVLKELERGQYKPQRMRNLGMKHVWEAQAPKLAKHLHQLRRESDLGTPSQSQPQS